MADLEISPPQSFRPIRTSRRGELYAWLLTLTVLLVLLFVPRLQGIFPLLGIILTVFFGLSALFISLHNWMERATIIRVEEQGLAFRNGLRNEHLTWEEITRVEVDNRSFGRRVHVIGEQGHFAFYTQGVVKLGGRASEMTGFEKGEEILSMILEKSRVALSEESSKVIQSYVR